MLKKMFFPLILVAALVGCREKEFDWVVKIDDRSIDPATYVSAQMQIYMEAQTLADDSTHVLDGTIDGISGSQWITENTIEGLKRKVFIDKEFDRLHLKFGDGVDKFITMFGEEGWDSVSRIYANNGLDIEYYIEHLKFLHKEQLVFNAIFLSDNENAVTDREIEDYLNKNLCRVSLFKVPRHNYDGSLPDEETHSKLLEVIDESVEKINRGGAISIVSSDCISQAAALLGDPADYSAGVDYVTTAFISNSGTRLVYDFMEEFFHHPQGKCLYYELEDAYYICQKIPLCDTQVEYMFLKQEVASHLRDKEFSRMIQRACEEMDVEVNREAIAVYTPDKINMTVS